MPFWKEVAFWEKKIVWSLSADFFSSVNPGLRWPSLGPQSPDLKWLWEWYASWEGILWAECWTFVGMSSHARLVDITRFSIYIWGLWVCPGKKLDFWKSSRPLPSFTSPISHIFIMRKQNRHLKKSVLTSYFVAIKTITLDFPWNSKMRCCILG